MTTTGSPQPYDFRRPNRFSREHVRALQIVNETFARQFATVLSTTLRVVSQVNVTSLNQLSYNEYVWNTPNPSLLAVLTLDPLPGSGVFQLPMGIAMGVIDRLLGGPGSGNQPERALSDIETGLLRELVQRIVHEFGYAFESLGAMRPKVDSLESDPQFMQLAGPSEPVVVSAYDVHIGDIQSEATLCLPFSSLHPVLESISARNGANNHNTADAEVTARALAERLEATTVDVAVQFQPVSLPSREILDLRVGDVLPLHHRVSTPLDVCAQGVSCAAAVPGASGPRLACMVVER